MATAGTLLAGCGFGAGSQDGSAELLVTRDYGRQVMVEKSLDKLTESENALRLLDASADIETRYSGGFVQSVSGISGGIEAGRNQDWFYSVNGVVAERGAAEFEINAGDQVWWDYRDWTDAMEIEAVVGAWPAPLKGGYDGEVWPVSIECVEVDRVFCGDFEERLSDQGVDSTTVDRLGASPEGSLRLVLGRWFDIETDDQAQFDSDPSTSGVFARFEEVADEDHLIGLDQRAQPARDFGPNAGLITATRKGDDPPVWFITSGQQRGLEAAVRALDANDLKGRYSAVAQGDVVSSLPLP